MEKRIVEGTLLNSKTLLKRQGDPWCRTGRVRESERESGWKSWLEGIMLKRGDSFDDGLRLAHLSFIDCDASPQRIWLVQEVTTQFC